MSVPFLSLKDVTALHGAEIEQAVRRVAESGWYLQGAENERFEKNYAAYIGSRFAVGCANGLDALIWIFRAYIEMGVMKPGDEVIVPANTYIATILAITENGLKPVLCEPRLDTLEIDDSKIEALITEKTRAITIVHLYGRNAYTEKIGSLCARYGLKLIEDNAQAHGCRPPEGSRGIDGQPIASNRRTGSIGDAAGHSFYPGKNLGALGDAGAVTTSDEELAATVRALANYGSTKKYVFKYCGRNSRLDEIHAAVLDVKLKYIDQDNRHRQKLAALYYEGLEVSGENRRILENRDSKTVILPNRLPDDNNVYHLFPILCNRRDELQNYLKDKGIDTIIHYPIAPHKQECYKQWNSLSFPITEQIADCELSLPIGPATSADDVHSVIEAVNSFK